MLRIIICWEMTQSYTCCGEGTRYKRLVQQAVTSLTAGTASTVTEMDQHKARPPLHQQLLAL